MTNITLTHYNRDTTAAYHREGVLIATAERVPWARCGRGVEYRWRIEAGERVIGYSGDLQGGLRLVERCVDQAQADALAWRGVLGTVNMEGR